MPTNITGMLERAQRGQYTVGNFNVYSYETIRGVLEAGGSGRAGHRRLRRAVSGEHGLRHRGGDLRVRCGEPGCRVRDPPGSLQVARQRLPGHQGRIHVRDCTTALLCPSTRTWPTPPRWWVAHALGVSVEAESGSLASGDNSQESEDNDSQVAARARPRPPTSWPGRAATRSRCRSRHGARLLQGRTPHPPRHPSRASARPWTCRWCSPRQLRDARRRDCRLHRGGHRQDQREHGDLIDAATRLKESLAESTPPLGDLPPASSRTSPLR